MKNPCKAITAFLLLTAACGPIYQTQYDYYPPKSESGTNCVMSCENIKMQCEQLEDMRAETCRQRAEWEQQRCEDYRRRHRKEPKWYSCGSTSCSTDYERCEQNYRRCYQTCGGRVEARQVCVFNCKQEEQQ